MKHALWLLLAIVLFLPACTVQPIMITPIQINKGNITTVVTTLSASTVTPTKLALQTKVLPISSATPVPPTPFISPSPTVTPTPGPLATEGPWLVVSNDEVMMQASSGYIVMNADGTNLQPVPLPDLAENRVWRILSEPRGPFLAFRTVQTEGAPFDIQADGIDDFVWIVKLPDNRVVRKLPLLNDAAWIVVQEVQKKDPFVFESGFEIPTQLGLVVNPDSFQWSPHGRYLTYSAALDGSGTDLYIYDTEKDISRRLTQGRTGAQIWFWSPDGSTLFYRNGEITTVEYAMPDLAYMDGVYALDLFQGERKLYDPETWEQIINLTDEDFLVMDHGFEAIPWNLRLVNYKTGSIRTLYKDGFSSAASNPGQSNDSIVVRSIQPLQRPL